MYPAQIPHSLFSAGIKGSCLNQNYSIAEGKCQSCQAIKKQADRKNGTDQPALVISVELDAIASALFSRIPDPQGQVRSPQLCRLLHCTPNPQRRCQIRSDRNIQQALQLSYASSDSAERHIIGAAQFLCGRMQSDSPVQHPALLFYLPHGIMYALQTIQRKHTDDHDPDRFTFRLLK